MEMMMMVMVMMMVIIIRLLYFTHSLVFCARAFAPTSTQLGGVHVVCISAQLGGVHVGHPVLLELLRGGEGER